MPFTYLLAYRFLLGTWQEKNIASMVKVCFLSILLGTFSLALVAAIMTGFEKETHKKLQGIHADILIDAGAKAFDYEKLRKVLIAEYGSKISALSPTHVTQMLIAADNPSQSQICLLKAVNPSTEPQVSTLDSMITTSVPDRWNALEEESIFMGQALAQRLNLAVGDQAVLLYPEEEQIGTKIVLEEKKVTVAGLIKTGIQDFDEHVIIASFSLLKQLYPVKITQVAIKVAPNVDQKDLIASLKKRLHLPVFSWKDLYPPLLSALMLEKYAMIFILALVTLIASLNIISLLFMYVTQKRVDIAILKAMGMSNFAVSQIFIAISLIITTVATLCGILAAWIATLLLHRFPFIQLPDVYCVTHLPAELTWAIVGAVALLSCMISIIAALIPVQKIKAVSVARVLKGFPT